MLSNPPSCMFLAGLIADDVGVLSIHDTKDWLVTRMPVVVLQLGRWRVFSGQYEWRRPCTSGRSQRRQHRCALPIALVVDVPLKDLFEDHSGRRNLRGVMVFSSLPTDDRWRLIVGSRYFPDGTRAVHSLSHTYLPPEDHYLCN